MKTIYVSVSNDLFNDNRVEKTCNSLVRYGLKVHLVGKKTKKSPHLPSYPYDTYRIRPLFNKNFVYYAELNIRLFFYLLNKKTDILWANDLDTLLACYLVSKIRKKPLIFDSHELFWAVAELKDSKIKKMFWQKIEKMILPHLKYVFTVCNPIKDYFEKTYKIPVSVVRNIPLYEQSNQKEKHYPINEKYIIWQGSANIDRGLEELVEAMKNVPCKLYIIGRGDIIPNLQQQIIDNNLQDKVFLLGRLSFKDMMSYTRNATLAISIDKPTNENYKISLPNKIFEYINSCTPILCTPLQEIEPIIKKYDIGFFALDLTPTTLSKQINDILNNEQVLQEKSNNCLLAQKDLSWQNEEKQIFSILNTILK